MTDAQAGLPLSSGTRYPNGMGFFNGKGPLSRSRAGVRGRTLIVNLPGSVKGATESLEAVLPLLEHAVDQLRGRAKHT